MDDATRNVKQLERDDLSCVTLASVAGVVFFFFLGASYGLVFVRVLLRKNSNVPKHEAYSQFFQHHTARIIEYGTRREYHDIVAGILHQAVHISRRPFG